MNVSDFKLSIHGGMWPICEVLEIKNVNSNLIHSLVLFSDGHGYLAGTSFANVDDLIDLLVEAKQQEAKRWRNKRMNYPLQN